MQKYVDRVRFRRWASALLGGAILLVAGAAVGWAGTILLAPTEGPVQAQPYALVELYEGEVSSSLTLNAKATWTQSPAGSNHAVGTVTNVRVVAGEQVEVGSVLYDVNLRPVTIAQGDVPAFRAISKKATGADVRQLQQLLADTGFYDGYVDGEFGELTERSVRTWQRALGIEPDGVVLPGDVIFVQELPSRIVLDSETIARGAILMGGESAVWRVDQQPSFLIPATMLQAGMMPEGTHVEISIGGATWLASVSGQQGAPDLPDQINVTLGGRDGSPICADDCGLLQFETETYLPTRVITQESVAGVVAPGSSLRTDADGEVSVIDAEGKAHVVEVVASSRGMVVVRGVPAGMHAQIPSPAAKG